MLHGPPFIGKAGVDKRSDNRRFVRGKVAEEGGNPQGSTGGPHTAAGERVVGVQLKGTTVRRSLMTFSVLDRKRTKLKIFSSKNIL